MTLQAVVDPSVPNHAQIQEEMFRLEREELAPYELPGNRLCRDSYDNLPLPWDVDPPIKAFRQARFTKLEWDRDGHLSQPDHFFLGDEHVDLRRLQGQLSTASMVTRWREAHPELAGTERDVVEVVMREIRKAVGGDSLIIGKSCFLLLFKRE